jgi:hypothetical protein
MNSPDRDHHPLCQGVGGEPSRGLHARRRWFADVQRQAGGNGSAAQPLYRLHVIRDDGFALTMPEGSGVEPMPGSVRWPSHANDRMLAWIGRRWNNAGAVVEGGIYTAEVRYDKQDSIVELKGVSEAPTVSLPLIKVSDSGAWYRSIVPDADSHDWSPDGESIVLASVKGELRRVEIGQKLVKRLTEYPASDPVWSPDGQLVAFRIRSPFGGMAIVSSTGGEPEVVFGPLQGTPFAVTAPCWSPSGRHVLFGYLAPRNTPPEQPADVDLMVVDLLERRYVNLTPDIPGALRPLAWR